VRELSIVCLTEIAVKQARGTLAVNKSDATIGVADL
jgi:hypothetical protein